VNFFGHPKTKERDAIMRKILKDILEGQVSAPENKIESECLSECINRGYITGIYVQRTIDNSCFFESSGNPSVTYTGVQFLENKQPHWQRTLNTVLSVLALVISLFSAFLALLANFQDIKTNLTEIVDILIN